MPAAVPRTARRVGANCASLIQLCRFCADCAWTKPGTSESVFGHTYITFRYLQISLPRLSAGDYVERGSLAGRLASLMRPAKRTSAARIALYIACLRGVQRAVDAGEAV